MFLWYPKIDVQRRPVLLFDGAGLALFAVTGTQKALVAGLNPVMAAIMGMLTGIGGGMLRDVLVNETPTVLRADLYAVAALAAGVVVVTGHVLHYPSFAFMIAGAFLCFWLESHGHIPRLASAGRRDGTSIEVMDQLFAKASEQTRVLSSEDDPHPNTEESGAIRPRSVSGWIDPLYPGRGPCFASDADDRTTRIRFHRVC